MDSTKVPLGITTEPTRAYVDPDGVKAYALASNDDNPRYQSGEAVPPLYAVAVAWQSFWNYPGLPAEATEGMIGGVHGEHDLRLHKPMVPGTFLTTTATRVAVVCSKAGMNSFIRLVTVDDDGDQVIEQWWSSLSRGPVTGGDHGDPPANHDFPESARSALVGTASLYTTFDQTYRYAGASADRAAMHVDDSVAQRFGFPRKFNQGLCSLAITSRGLIDLAAGGDPRRIKRIAVRFSAPVFPGDDIEVSVYDAGGGTFAFEATSAGRTTFTHGLVEVA